MNNRTLLLTEVGLDKKSWNKKDCSSCSRRKWYQEGYKDGQKKEFDIDMMIEQLEIYGKYEGILHSEGDKCENYIPVSIAKRIVKARGLGGVFGYTKDN